MLTEFSVPPVAPSPTSGNLADHVVENAAVMGDDARSEIARLDALSRATADDPEDVVPCVPCGRAECSCGVGEDEEQCA